MPEVRIDALERAADDYDGRLEMAAALLDRLEETVSVLETRLRRVAQRDRQGERPESPAAR